MQFRLHDHGQITDEVRNLIERKSHPIERRLIHVHDGLKALDVTITRRHRDGSHVAKLVLNIPDRILAASGDGPTVVSAIGAAFDALADRLDESMAKLSGTPLIRRQQLAYRHPSEQLAREEAEIELLEATEEFDLEMGGATDAPADSLGPAAGEAHGR